MTVHDDGDTESIAHLRDGIAERSEASTEPLKPTTNNGCFETVDALLKANTLGAMMSGQSFHSSVTSLSSHLDASRRNRDATIRLRLRYVSLRPGSDINIAAFIALCWNADGCFHC